MNAKVSRSVMERTFCELESAAIHGRRCPTGLALGAVANAAVRELARRERILLEISGHNWRTVTILTGPNKGKKTQPDPNGARIYRVIGVEDRVNGEIYKPQSRWA